MTATIERSARHRYPEGHGPTFEGVGAARYLASELRSAVRLLDMLTYADDYQPRHSLPVAVVLAEAATGRGVVSTVSPEMVDTTNRSPVVSYPTGSGVALATWDGLGATPTTRTQR